MFGQMAAGDLQCQITPEENARDCPRLLWIQMKIATDPRKGKGDIRAVDEGNRVHYQRDRNNSKPALRPTA